MSDVNEKVESKVESKVEDDFEGHQIGGDMFDPKVEDDFEGHKWDFKAEPKWEEKVEE